MRLILTPEDIAIAVGPQWAAAHQGRRYDRLLYWSRVQDTLHGIRLAIAVGQRHGRDESAAEVLDAITLLDRIADYNAYRGGV